MEAESTSAEAEEEAMWKLPYYHGDLDREETEQLLTRDGDFLVRKGEEVPGQALLFVLSVIVFGHARHVIFRRKRGLIAVDFGRERGFAPISNFVDFHLERNDSISSRELVMLRRAIGRPAQEYELNISNDVWLDTLMWLDRTEVGTKFALINARFNSIVDTQLKARKWAMGELHIQRAAAAGTGAEIRVQKDDDDNNEGTKFEVLAIANSPLPASIIGINALYISYINQEVITFLQRMRRLFRSDIALEFSILPTEHRSWSIMARQIWPLIGHGVDTLVNMKKGDFALLRKHISPTVLFDCPNLRRIYTDMYPQWENADVRFYQFWTRHVHGNVWTRELLGKGIQMPAAHDLYEWLHMLHPGGRPKVLIFPKWKKQWPRFRDDLKKTFVEASTAARFIIYTPVPRRFQQRFNVENALTQERLALASRSGSALFHPMRSTNALMLRCPVEFDGQHVMSWETEANQLFKQHIIIGFGDEDIGPTGV